MKKLSLLLVALFPMVAYPQQVYKCTGPDGKISYSQAPCAQGSNATIPLDSAPQSSQGDDYWSVTNQVQRIEAREAVERQDRERKRREEQARRAAQARFEAEQRARTEALMLQMEQQRQLQASQDAANQALRAARRAEQQARDAQNEAAAAASRAQRLEHDAKWDRMFGK
jgi:hypothetical protein